MHFSLTYQGKPGNVSAQLLCNGTTVDTTSGLADRKAAERWADKAARDYKVANTPEASASHEVVLSGNKTFSL